MIVADGSHLTAAQRGGEAKDKDKPLPDLQRDRCSPQCPLPHMQGPDNNLCDEFQDTFLDDQALPEHGLASNCTRGLPNRWQA